MNRSILIVICDFLLVSLVAFSNFENPSSEAPAQQQIEVKPAAAKAAPPNSDLASALKLALDEERRSRERLAAELSGARQSLQVQTNLLEQREAMLAQREAAQREIQENLRRTEAEAGQLAQERALLEQQVKATEKTVHTLEESLVATRTDAKRSVEQIQALQNDLRKRQEESEKLRQNLTDLQKSQTNIIAAKQQLDTKLAVAETEKRLAAEQLTTMRSEVQTVRAEKAQLQANTAKLAEGVTSLAEKSSALTQEIRENRPLAANAIYSEFVQNRVDTEFFSTRSGAFGREVKKKKDAQTLLVTDGSQTYALYHIMDTPLALWPPGTDWESLTGTIRRGYYSYGINRISFLNQDPRIVVVPLSPAEARSLGSKIYKIAPDPFKFADAVLVGANEGYYGECRFQIEPSTPQYVKMDRSLFRGLFGKFNPSRGDLVLSKTGEVLGIMVNNEYCAVLDKISVGVTLLCGDTLRAQQAGRLMDGLGIRLHSLPPKLQ